MNSQITAPPHLLSDQSESDFEVATHTTLTRQEFIKGLIGASVPEGRFVGIARGHRPPHPIYASGEGAPSGINPAQIADCLLHFITTNPVNRSPLGPSEIQVHPALATAQLHTSHDIGDLPSQGYLEYLGGIQTEPWTPLIQLNRLGFRPNQIAELLNVSTAQYRALMMWWSPTDKPPARAYALLTSNFVFDLAAWTGTPLTAILKDSYFRDQKHLPNVALHLHEELCRQSRKHLQRFDEWVWANLAKNYYESLRFSMCREDGQVQIAYRDGEHFYSSKFHRLRLEELNKLAPPLRDLAVNLKALLRPSLPNESTRNRVEKSVSHIIPIEEMYSYFTGRRQHHKWMNKQYKEKGLQHPRDQIQYYKQRIQPSNRNNFEKAFEDYPYHAKAYVDRSMRGGVFLPYSLPENYTDIAWINGDVGKLSNQFDALTSWAHQGLVNQDMWVPAHQAWIDDVSKALQAPTRRGWSSFHMLLQNTIHSVVVKLISMQVDTHHGQWLWLHQMNKYIVQLIRSREELDSINLRAFLHLMCLVPIESTPPSFDLEVLTVAVGKLGKCAEARNLIECPDYFNKVLRGQPVPQAYKSKLHVLRPRVLSCIQVFREAWLDNWELWDQSVMDAVTDNFFPVHPHMHHQRTVEHPSWIDVLALQLQEAVDQKWPLTKLVPEKSRLVVSHETQRLLPSVNELLLGNLRLEELNLDLPEIDEHYFGRLWIMSPGVISQSSKVRGKQVHVDPYRNAAIHAVYDELPEAQGFMRTRWRHFNTWFSSVQPVGSWVEDWTHTKAKQMVEENQLCGSVFEIENRLIPYLRFAHVSVPDFIKWMMRLRDISCEIAACHYYIDNKNAAGEHNMHTWVAPSGANTHRQHDQLFLLHNWYLGQCHQNLIPVPQPLELEMVDAWWDQLEARNGLLKADLDERQTRQRREKFEAAELQHAHMLKTQRQGNHNALRELEHRDKED